MIYVEQYDYLSAQTNKESYWINYAELDHQLGNEQAIKKPDKVIKTKPFNLLVDGFINQIPNSVALKNSSLRFEKNKTGDFDFVLTESNSEGKDALVKNCRPRLISLNPSQSDVIVSVFEKNGVNTYHLNVASKHFTLLENLRYFSVSWLDDLRYVCINENGLFLKRIDFKTGNKLNDLSLPEWCQSIDLSLPKYELQVGFMETKTEAEQLVEKLPLFGFSARMKYHQTKNKPGYRIRIGGFGTKQVAKKNGKKLKQQGYDFWVANIDNLFDFYNRVKLSEIKSFNGKTVRIDYQKDDFLRSKIVLIDKNGTKKLIVDEMNNLPDQSRFKDLNR